jgi:hypothetical protein
MLQAVRSPDRKLTAVIEPSAATGSFVPQTCQIAPASMLDRTTQGIASPCCNDPTDKAAAAVAQTS